MFAELSKRVRMRKVVFLSAVEEFTEFEYTLSYL